MIKFKNYLCKELLSDSEVSVVYRCEQKSNAKSIVIKILKETLSNKDDLSRYKHEYEILKQLSNNEGVIDVFGIEQYNNTLFLTLEDFNAVPLSRLFQEEEISLEISLKIFHSVAESISYLHSQEVLHHNISPSNILYNMETNQCKLIDLGFSSLISNTKTRDFNRISHDYMSPEQTGRTDLGIDYRSDLYSLGITFYYLLSGQLPFHADDELELIHLHIAGHELALHELVPNIPKQISDIVAKLMSKSPDNRYQTAKGLMEDLDIYIKSLFDGDLRPFSLGKKDITNKLFFAKKIYGRDNEIKEVNDLFENKIVRGSESALLLVSGYSGTGKTTLIQEMRNNPLMSNSIFISGKFDQVYQYTPYFGFKQAVSSLVDIWLTYDKVILDELRNSLKSNLGDLGPVLVDFVPRLELIIGAQKPLEPLPGLESQNRFHIASQRFFQSTASSSSPLIFFLDDLQWVDIASLNLLSNLLMGNQISNVLFIGAYRDNETPSDHPLISMINKLQEEEINIKNIKLKNLSESILTEMFSQLFNTEQKDVLFLSNLTHEKTLGNPFFTEHFLNTIYKDGLLRNEGEKWKWKISEIEKCKIPSDIVELMIERITGLSKEIQDILSFAASIGNKFDLKTLMIVVTFDKNSILSYLEEALHEGLLIKHSNELYSFSHDRIQQAAYSLNDNHEETHLTIARLLILEGEPKGEVLFQVVNHFNQAIGLIQNHSELLNIMQLNLNAARTAKKETAYEAAISYLNTVFKYIDEEVWMQHYSLAYDIYSEMAWCKFYSNDDEGLDVIFETLHRYASIQDDITSIYIIQMEYQHLRGNYNQAVEIQKEVLKDLGILIDENTVGDLLQDELANVQKLLGERSIEKLSEAPELTSPRQLAILDILMRLWTSAYLASRLELVAWSSCKMTTISLKDGNCHLASFAYMNYAFVCVAILEDFDTGHRFGRAAITLSENYKVTLLRGKAYLLFAVFINHWKEPLSSSLEYSLKAFPLLVESGDWTYAGYCAEFIISDSTIWGMPCDNTLEELQRYIPFLKNNTPVILQEFVYPACINPVLQLKGKTLNDATLDDQYFQEENFLAEFGNNPLALSYFQAVKLRSLYWFGHLDEALEMIDCADFIASVALAQAKVPEVYFYASLIILAAAPHLKENQQNDLLFRVKKYQEKMELWATNSPKNFKHKYLLVEAELANFNARKWEALEYYESSINDALANGYINNAAVAYECASSFFLKFDMKNSALQFLSDAISSYEHWGATEKVAQLEKKYSELDQEFKYNTERKLSLSVDKTNHNNVDLISIMQSSQALATQINLEKLLEHMLEIAKKSAGADNSLLIVLDNGKWKLLAKSDSKILFKSYIGKEEFYPTESQVPFTLMNYCARVKESQIINNPLINSHFFSDPYFNSKENKSVMSVPLIHSNIVIGILYFENTMIESAFKKEHVQVLELLSSQMAISIENAKFYRSLEEKVHDRTLELEHTNDNLKNANKKLEELSNLDSLTQVANRRLFENTLKKEWKRHQRNNNPISIVLCDIDYFKQYNDTYGHLEGDECLKKVASALKNAALRPHDLVSRFGGEEFIVILPETNIDALKTIVKNMQKAVSELAVKHENSSVSQYLTLSYGALAVKPSNDMTAKDIIDKCDQALYEAKNKGRNQVVYRN